MDPANLTDNQYVTIVRIIGDNRKRQSCLQDVLDVTSRLLKTGCQWRMLPSDFPKRHIVTDTQGLLQRSVAWLDDFRRLAKDYERKIICSENMIYLAFIALMMKWL